MNLRNAFWPFLAIFLIGTQFCHALSLVLPPQPSQAYEHSVFLDKENKFKLYWDFTDDSITFEVIAETTGYVGIGWSAKGSMKDSDIITAWVDNQGQGHIQDRYGTVNGKPKLDTVQNVKLDMAKEEDGFTVIKFTRKLDTCDEEHDRPITDDTLRMIWAMGSTDPATEDNLYYHGTNRGVKSLFLTGIAPMVHELPTDAKTQDIVFNNFQMPAKRTHYECIHIALPPVDTKHHIVRYDPVITAGNEAHVHHMIAYFCPLEVNKADMTNITNMHYACNGFEATEINSQCHNPVLAWAVGGGNFSFPEDAGLPFGTLNETMFVRLEIHYDNPQAKQGVIDSSGVRIYYTPTLRKHDLSVLMVGKTVQPMHIIPPGQKAFISTAYCPKSCLNQGFDRAGDTEITVIAALPHTHLAGRAVRHRHIRGGVEIPYMVDDQAYDFNHQMAELKAEPITVKKGDEFILECVYNTEDRTEVTYGGISTMEEMCMSFVYYYPRIAVVQCMSSVQGLELFPIWNKYRNVPADYDASKLSPDEWWDVFKKNITWNTGAADWWQTTETTKNVDVVCAFDGNEWDVKFQTDVEPVKVHKAYKPPDSPCSSVSKAASTEYVTMLLVVSAILLAATGQAL